MGVLPSWTTLCLVRRTFANVDGYTITAGDTSWDMIAGKKVRQ